MKTAEKEKEVLLLKWVYERVCQLPSNSINPGVMYCLFKRLTDTRELFFFICLISGRKSV